MRVEIRIRNAKRIKTILTSYEIVWAIARKAPNKEYLELDVQPAPKIEYTFSEDKQRKIITAREILKVWYGRGIKLHVNKASIRLIIGARKKGVRFDTNGFFNSLQNNLRASANG